MQTIEEKFNQLISASYPPSHLSESRELELKIMYFAAHAHMFDKVNKMNSLPDTEISKNLDALESETQSFLLENPKIGPVSDTDVGDTSIRREMSKKEIQAHAKESLIEANQLFIRHVTNPEDQFTTFVDALNARVSIFCAVLRGTMGLSDVSSYLEVLSKEENTINFELVDDSTDMAAEGGAAQRASTDEQGRVLH